MGTVASQITSLKIVYSTVYSGTDEIKHQSSASLAFCAGNSPVTGEFPAQNASNAENVSIWWRHHELMHWYNMTGNKKLMLPQIKDIGNTWLTSFAPVICKTHSSEAGDRICWLWGSTPCLLMHWPLESSVHLSRHGLGCVGQTILMSRPHFIYLGQNKSEIRFKMSI